MYTWYRYTAGTYDVYTSDPVLVHNKELRLRLHINNTQPLGCWAVPYSNKLRVLPYHDSSIGSTRSTGTSVENRPTLL